MRLLAYLISIHVLLRYNSGTFIAQKGNFCKADLELFEMTLGRKRKFMVMSEIQYFFLFLRTTPVVVPVRSAFAACDRKKVGYLQIACQ